MIKFEVDDEKNLCNISAAINHIIVYVHIMRRWKKYQAKAKFTYYGSHVKMHAVFD